MKAVWRWTVRIGGGLLLLMLLALAVLYVLSERVVDGGEGVDAHPVAVPTDSAAIAEGRRLATLRGCYEGCHGKETEGGPFLDPPGLRKWLMGRIVAPDLGRLADERSVAELERSIRHGVRADGESTLIMPSSMFQGLSDEDLGKILAFLRSRPADGGTETAVRLGPMARFGLLMGPFVPQTERIEHDPPHPATTPTGDTLAHGRYLAHTLCTECHGPDLEGSDGSGAPPLAVVAGYGPDAFARLLRTGEPPGDRELDLMKEVALGRFSHLTDREMAALYAYLRARAAEEATGSAAAAGDAGGAR